MTIEEVLHQYKGNMARVCKMFSSHTEERKDLFQEISLQVYKSIPSFRADSSLTTFIYRISINVCMRYKFKYQMNQKRTSLDQDDWYLEDDTMIKLDQKERLEELFICINRLNDVDKTLVLLYLEDMNYKEIAQISGITENHVAIKMSRIREKLFNCLTINPL